MRIELRYPLVVRHVPAGMQAYRHLACSRTKVVDVQEIDAVDAPVVIELTATRRDKEITYRMIGDHLHLPVKSSRANGPLRASADVDYPGLPIVDLPQYDFPCEPLVDLALSKVKKVREEKGHVVPQHGHPAKWPSLGADLPPKAVLEDIVEWEGYFDDFLENLVFVDGVIWRRAPEPLVVVYRNNVGWNTGLTSECGLGQDLYRFHFPLDRWSDAEALCRSLAEKSDRPAHAGKLFHDPLWVSTLNTDMLDIDMLAQRVEDTINRSTNNKATRTVNGRHISKIVPHMQWRDFPTDLFEAYVGLRRYLEIPRNEIDDSATGSAVEHIEAIISLAEQHDLNWLVSQPAAVLTHIEKWHSRPIELAVGTNPGLQP